MKKTILATIFTSFTLSSFAADKVILSEEVLYQLIQSDIPSIQEIEINHFNAQDEKLEILDSLSARLKASGQKYQSKEELLNSFDGGVTQDSSSYSLGLTKPTAYGVNMEAKLFTQSVTNTFITDASTTGASLSLSVDLWQNLFGRQTANSLRRADKGIERSKLEKKRPLLKILKTN